MNDHDTQAADIKAKVTTVFIDRDGVINRDSPDYIKSRDEFHFLPGTLEAFRRLHEHGLSAIVITNQSVIGRKLTTPDELKLIFETMTTDVEKAGGAITDIVFCPHLPSDQCRCRKPEPGMIFTARDRHGVDLKRSVMIGDSAKDMLCAENAGVPLKILVKTGNGLKARAELDERGTHIDHVAEDLLAAVKWIISDGDLHE